MYIFVIHWSLRLVRITKLFMGRQYSQTLGVVSEKKEATRLLKKVLSHLIKQASVSKVLTVLPNAPRAVAGLPSRDSCALAYITAVTVST